MSPFFFGYVFKINEFVNPNESGLENKNMTWSQEWGPSSNVAFNKYQNISKKE